MKMSLSHPYSLGVAPAWPGRVKPSRSFYLTGPRTVNNYNRPHPEFEVGGADGLLFAARIIC